MWSFFVSTLGRILYSLNKDRLKGHLEYSLRPEFPPEIKKATAAPLKDRRERVREEGSKGSGGHLFLVAGPGGSGKSFFAEMLAMDHASSAEGLVLDASLSDITKVLKPRSPADSLMSYLASKVGRQIGGIYPSTSLRGRLLAAYIVSSTPWSLLLDDVAGDASGLLDDAGVASGQTLLNNLHSFTLRQLRRARLFIMTRNVDNWVSAVSIPCHKVYLEPLCPSDGAELFRETLRANRRSLSEAENKVLSRVPELAALYISVAAYLVVKRTATVEECLSMRSAELIQIAVLRTLRRKDESSKLDATSRALAKIDISRTWFEMEDLEKCISSSVEAPQTDEVLSDLKAAGVIVADKLNETRLRFAHKALHEFFVAHSIRHNSYGEAGQMKGMLCESAAQVASFAAELGLTLAQMRTIGEASPCGFGSIYRKRKVESDGAEVVVGPNRYAGDEFARLVSDVVTHHRGRELGSFWIRHWNWVDENVARAHRSVLEEANALSLLESLIMLKADLELIGSVLSRWSARFGSEQVDSAIRAAVGPMLASSPDGTRLLAGKLIERVAAPRSHLSPHGRFAETVFVTVVERTSLDDFSSAAKTVMEHTSLNDFSSAVETDGVGNGVVSMLSGVATYNLSNPHRGAWLLGKANFREKPSECLRLASAVGRIISAKIAPEDRSRAHSHRERFEELMFSLATRGMEVIDDVVVSPPIYVFMTESNLPGRIASEVANSEGRSALVSTKLLEQVRRRECERRSFGAQCRGPYRPDVSVYHVSDSEGEYRWMSCACSCHINSDGLKMAIQDAGGVYSDRAGKWFSLRFSMSRSVLERESSSGLRPNRYRVQSGR